MTHDREVVRKKQIAGRYARCEGCGRIHWWFKTDELSREIEAAQKKGLHKTKKLIKEKYDWLNPSWLK
jgi:hypothetical protein